MRCWHYKLLPYLPKSQLIAQWRELNSIFKKQDKHILINYIYEYDKKELLGYTYLVIEEMQKRNVKIKLKTIENCVRYFRGMFLNETEDKIPCEPFKNHHNDRYLLQCFYNLQEKYDRGQKDFDMQTYNELYNFVNKELFNIRLY